MAVIKYVLHERVLHQGKLYKFFKLWITLYRRHMYLFMFMVPFVCSRTCVTGLQEKEWERKEKIKAKVWKKNFWWIFTMKQPLSTFLSNTHTQLAFAHTHTHTSSVCTHTHTSSICTYTHMHTHTHTHTHTHNSTSTTCWITVAVLIWSLLPHWTHSQFLKYVLNEFLTPDPILAHFPFEHMN